MMFCASIFVVVLVTFTSFGLVTSYEGTVEINNVNEVDLSDGSCTLTGRFFADQSSAIETCSFVSNNELYPAGGSMFFDCKIIEENKEHEKGKLILEMKASGNSHCEIEIDLIALYDNEYRFYSEGERFKQEGVHTDSIFKGISSNRGSYGRFIIGTNHNTHINHIELTFDHKADKNWRNIFIGKAWSLVGKHSG